MVDGTLWRVRSVGETSEVSARAGAGRMERRLGRRSSRGVRRCASVRGIERGQAALGGNCAAIGMEALRAETRNEARCEARQHGPKGSLIRLWGRRRSDVNPSLSTELGQDMGRGRRIAASLQVNHRQRLDAVVIEPLSVPAFRQGAAFAAWPLHPIVAAAVLMEATDQVSGLAWRGHRTSDCFAARRPTTCRDVRLRARASLSREPSGAILGARRRTPVCD